MEGPPNLTAMAAIAMAAIGKIAARSGTNPRPGPWSVSAPPDQVPKLGQADAEGPRGQGIERRWHDPSWAGDD